ncbi:hypothetical protein [Streptomyces sp. NPDC088910]|uniref:hypothetical protein n=1 Tax=Streptomyces sp. NPDC088910 TaxID=3365911 RepID=UPI00382DCBB4
MGWGALAAVGAAAWAALARGDSRQTAYIALLLAVLSVLAGARSLRRASLPFRLRVDEYGITLDEHRLGWGEIEGVGLRYGPADPSGAANRPSPSGR